MHSPLDSPIHFSFSLIAEQVQNLHEETKGNHMLIPIFHALLLCSPKEGITNGMSSFHFIYMQNFIEFFFWMHLVKKKFKLCSSMNDKNYSLINYIPCLYTNAYICHSICGCRTYRILIDVNYAQMFTFDFIIQVQWTAELILNV